MLARIGFGMILLESNNRITKIVSKDRFILMNQMAICKNVAVTISE